MANNEHVALLRQGSLVWNEWRGRNPEVAPNLSDVDLSGTDLTGADLSGADISGGNLSGAFLSGADISEACLVSADLSNAILYRANLRDTVLIHANLFRADLRFANLVDAYFGDTDLSEAFLQYADLSDAAVLGTNFKRALLYHTNLTRANLRGAVLGQAVLDGTIFGSVNLSDTRGLDDCTHLGPSVIDVRTLHLSGDLPLSFLRGCGLPDVLIDYLPSLRDDPIQFCSCFISYSAKDQAFAKGLHADLQSRGVRCWFAPHDLKIGAKIWDAIDEAIRLMDKLLVILSEASIASDWVEDEVNKAYAEERERKETVLFPIRIDEAVMTTPEPWARKLRDQRNIGDFRQWKKPADYQKSLDRLLRDLKASGAE
jgi:uncharacterized protein YjbI with pentapeptide repeats